MGTALTGAIDGNYTAPATINVLFLDDGSGVGWENQGFITDADGRTFGYDGWTLYEQEQARLAFAQFSAVANVAFNFVTDIALADFVMASGDNEEVGGPGYWNVGGGSITVDGVDHVVDGVGVFNWEGRGWDFNGETGGLEAGGIGFVTLLDAIGQGLGLAHPHDTDGGSTIMDGVSSPAGDTGDFGLNQGLYTTMSLNDGWQTAPHGGSPSDSHGWQGSPMALDIAVLQETYGANTATNVTDTVYVLADTNVAGTYYQSIWDAGGADTISYGGNGHAIIDLRPATLGYEAGGGGFVSYVAGIHGGFTIAHGVLIENASGGAGNDRLIGNAADNVLTGGPGADRLIGGAGNDTASYRSAAAPIVADLADASANGGEAAGDVYGGIENLEGGRFADRLSGKAGANVLSGLAGDDDLLGRRGNDTLHGAAGNDALYGGAGDDGLLGGADNDRLYGGSRNDVLAGGSGDDRLFGGSGDDMLLGGSGDDWLAGEAGNDGLSGGGGMDRFVFRPGGGNDAVADFEDGFDRLDFRSFGFAAKSHVLDLATQAGADVLFDLPDGATVTLSSFDLDLLGANDILI